MISKIHAKFFLWHKYSITTTRGGFCKNFEGLNLTLMLRTLWVIASLLEAKIYRRNHYRTHKLCNIRSTCRYIIPYADAAGMMLQWNGMFTIGNVKLKYFFSKSQSKFKKKPLSYLIHEAMKTLYIPHLLLNNEYSTQQLLFIYIWCFNLSRIFTIGRIKSFLLQ